MENSEDHLAVPLVSIVVAMSRAGVIGYRNALPWHIPADLHHFKTLTWGGTVLMGKSTYLSLPHGALPGRRNMVLSHTVKTLPGCEVYASLEDALAHVSAGEDVFVIGGASVYGQALPLARRMYVTLVDAEPQSADTWFPSFEWSDWRITKKEKHAGFSFIDLSKRV